MQDNQLKYAFVSGTKEPVFIKGAKRTEVYACCKCGEQLIPVMGVIYDWHYRHKIYSECSGGPETAVHLLTKQFICESNRMRVASGYLNYENPKSEIEFGSIVPDVTAIANGMGLFFEVVVTHDMDSKKRQVYTNGNHICYKLDYSKIPYTISPEELKRLVLEDPSNKYLVCEARVNVNPVEVKKTASSSILEDVISFCKENPIWACIIFIAGCFVTYWLLTPKKATVNINNRVYRRPAF